MDWIAFTGGAATGAAAAFALVVAVGLRARKERAAKAIETPPEPQRWFPMPCGTRLELEATGYWIELVGKKGMQTYRGYDPEGDAIITGADLPGMKARLEEQAAYREEFAPPPAP